MIYSTELANQIQESKNKYLEAGIHDNVKFVSARVDKSINGNIFIEFKFEKDEQTMTHTEWESTKKPMESEEDFQNRANRQVKRILQILSCFYPKEALVFAGSSFSEFANWVVNLLNAANKDILLRVKIVYNNKGYTTLPNYCKFTFIEPMNLPEGQVSKITELNIDVFVRPITADKETTDVNPLDKVDKGVADTQNDDLPF
ncbi:MAG: hypothetical protein [Bacteriophage sp.]|jgi:hypothetical protein|nr:MAG: hypothetical protein [Bacteriophage sp.]UVX68480.1 MAG: hypothetical protein [Bacteriophage sp.]UVX89001.1 MAG: hypothetical protein [Bacteriophage sp.]DAP34038.1 MAG TPA: hypothetical protein [Caudoviricetes sp.]